MTFEGMALCCCGDDCWRQADPCICSEKQPPVYVPCNVADPLLVPDGDFAFEFFGECWLVTLASPIVDVLPAGAIEVAAILAPLDDCFDCCECFKLATLCACVEGPCPLVAVPCQVVTEDVVFEPSPGCCYEVGPASQEVLELPAGYILVGLVGLVPTCAECCAPFDCQGCGAKCGPVLTMMTSFNMLPCPEGFNNTTGAVAVTVTQSGLSCNYDGFSPPNPPCRGTIMGLPCDWLQCGGVIQCNVEDSGFWKAVVTTTPNAEFPMGECSDAGLCTQNAQAIWNGSLAFDCPQDVPWIFISGFGTNNMPALAVT